VKTQSDPNGGQQGGTGFARYSNPPGVRLEVSTTPAEATGYFISVIQTMGLPPEREARLLAPLRAAEAILRDGNPDNDGVACEKRQAFLDEVVRQQWGGDSRKADVLEQGENIMTCKEGQAEINVFRDFPSFEAATARLVEIDFEDQPPNGRSWCSEYDPPSVCTLLPDPLELEQVSFLNPSSTDRCWSPMCQPDPDNPRGANIILTLTPGSMIEFPSYADAAMLVVEGLGDGPFRIKVTDSAGNTAFVDGQAVPNSVAYLGFTSSRGISRCELLSVGVPGGVVSFSSVFYGRTTPGRGVHRAPASVPRP
jgi:hypothetical protein